MSDHQLDVLVRTIANPSNFSQTAHGPGHRIVHRGGKGKGADTASVHEPRLLDVFLSRKDEVHYYVRRLATPLVVDNWEYRWSEGTSAVTLDFVATFELLANEEHQARKLVEALHGAEGPGASLYALIKHHLHQAIARQLQECRSQDKNLLSVFRTSSIGIGESEFLNLEVSAKVRESLGGLHFRIGFRLQNVPPMQVEVKQEDVFTLGDSTRERKVVTTALLELDNYQTYKKTGLDTEDAIRATIRKSITQAVRRHLFAQKYYAIVRSFSTGTESIERQMRAHIESDAAKIGYRLNIFQTFPDIAALSLLEGVRIDLPAESFKYRPENSSGFVQMNVALTVRANDFVLLDRLIRPDDSDVSLPVRKQVDQICQDQIQRVGRMEFNLRFNEDVVPRLTSAIVSGLRAYGLESEIIYITQSPTEEAARFGAISGQTTDFSALIPPHAESGDADDLLVEGRFEVTGMAPDGWERFVRKDFGFRADSHWTESKLRQRALALEVPFEDVQPMSQELRRHLAIELELAEIRAGVANAIKEGLATHADLAAETRTPTGRDGLAMQMRRLAQAAIQREFGLIVDINGIVRADTDTEVSFRARRRAGHELIRDRARQEAELDGHKFAALAQGSIDSINEDFAMRKLLQSERSDDPARDLAAIDARLERETGGLNQRRDITHSAALQKLLNSAPASKQISAQPSETAAASTDDTVAHIQASDQPGASG